MADRETTLAEDISDLISETGQSLVDDFGLIAQKTNSVVVLTMTFNPDGTAGAQCTFKRPEEVLN